MTISKCLLLVMCPFLIPQGLAAQSGGPWTTREGPTEAEFLEWPFPVAGIVGADLFESHLVVIDLRGGRFGLLAR